MCKTFTCNLCGEKFKYRSNLKTHISSEHKGLHYIPNKFFYCNVCSYEARTNHQLITHMRTHTGERPFKCTVYGCGMEFAEHQVLKTHIKFKHSDKRPFKCNFSDCLYTAKTSAALSGHKKVHSGERPFACPNIGCNFRCKRNYALLRHLTSVHSEAKKFACSKCDHMTDRKDSLKAHMLSCHSESTKIDFTCSFPQCKAAFKSSDKLRLHFSNKHEERNIKCDHAGCVRKFANSNALYNHKRHVHSKRIHACPQPNCSYRATYLSKLASHMIVHDKRNRRISCSISGCQYKAKYTRTLIWHMRRHKTLRACPVRGCGQYLFKQKAMQDHAKLHNPLGRPFQCPLCFKYYQTLCGLKTHSITHTNEKIFTCGHCEFGTAGRASIRNHVSSVHPNVKFPFIILPLNNRQCLQCKVALPLGEFIVHSIGHSVPVVLLHRLEIKISSL